jgi:hypothetical protein
VLVAYVLLQASEAQKRVHDGANVGAVVLVPVIDEEERAIEEARKKAEAEKAEKAARRSFRRVNMLFICLLVCGSLECCVNFLA